MACFGEQEAALKSRWLPIDHEDATRMIHLLDRDRNGMVSYEEFRSFAYLLPESQVNSLSNGLPNLPDSIARQICDMRM